MHRRFLLVVGVIVLTAFNLRPTVASVGPVLPDLQADLGLSGSAAAALSTLPVLCFGLLAGVAPLLARRFGIESVLAAVSIVLCAALVGRVADGVGPLFAGTAVAGSAIAVANVLLPPLIKRDFPTRSGALMGVYSTTLSASAAIAAATTVPLGQLIGLGWRGALGIWAVPAALAALAWLPQTRAHTRPPPTPAVEGSVRGSAHTQPPPTPAAESSVPNSAHTQPPPTPAADRSLRGSALAWQVTAYFGLQSLSFYAVLAWLPSIYRDFGASPVQAGLLLGVAGLVQLPVTLVLPYVATRAANQVALILASTGLIGAGIAGVLLAPTAAAYLWVTLIGIGQGSCFALGLNLFVLRAHRVAESARLSAMAQGIGYVFSAFGPLLVGVLHDLTRSWTIPLGVLLALVIPQLALGALAGRSRYV